MLLRVLRSSLSTSLSTSLLLTTADSLDVALLGFLVDEVEKLGVGGEQKKRISSTWTFKMFILFSHLILSPLVLSMKRIRTQVFPNEDLHLLSGQLLVHQHKEDVLEPLQVLVHVKIPILASPS